MTNKLLGYVTSIVHLILVLSVYFITIFSFDLNILFLIFFGLTFLLVLNKAYKDCPLSRIEQDNIGTCMVDAFNKIFPIEYNKNRRYEVQLQYIFILWTMLFTKILFGFLQKDFANYLKINYTNIEFKELLK